MQLEIGAPIQATLAAPLSFNDGVNGQTSQDAQLEGLKHSWPVMM